MADSNNVASVKLRLWLGTSPQISTSLPLLTSRRSTRSLSLVTPPVAARSKPLETSTASSWPSTASSPSLSTPASRAKAAVNLDSPKIPVSASAISATSSTTLSHNPTLMRTRLASSESAVAADTPSRPPCLIAVSRHLPPSWVPTWVASCVRVSRTTIP